MIRYFLSIFISLLFFNQTFAKDVSINENIDLKFVCDLDKKIKSNVLIINNFLLLLLVFGPALLVTIILVFNKFSNS